MSRELTPEELQKQINRELDIVTNLNVLVEAIHKETTKVIALAKEHLAEASLLQHELDIMRSTDE